MLDILNRSFQQTDNIDYIERLPSGLVDLAETFPSNTGFTKYTEGTPGTTNVASNLYTITHSSGALNDIVVKNTVSFTMPQVWAEITIGVSGTGATGYDNGGVGIVKDANNFLFASMDRLAGLARIQIKIGGSNTFLSSTSQSFGTSFKIGLSLVANSACVWVDAGSGWTYVCGADVTSYYDFRTSGNLSGWNPGFTLANGGGNSVWDFSAFNVGRFGGVGMRDQTLVTLDDGTPYRPTADSVQFTATCPDPRGIAYCGVFELNLVSKALAQKAALMVSRGGKVYNDLAAHVIRYPNGDRRVLIASWGNGFGGSLQVYHGLLTSGDVLSGSNVVSLSQITLPGQTGGSPGAYDPMAVWDAANSRWLIAYTLTDDTTFSGNPFYPALATTTNWSSFTLVAKDSANTGYEGTKLIPYGSSWLVVAGGPAGPGNSSRVYDATLTFQGALDCTFSGGTDTQPHPMVWFDSGYYRLLSFDNAKYQSGNFTWGNVRLYLSDGPTVAFVNAGAVGSQTSGTSITAPQPASVVPGNLLIACFTCSTDENQTISAGWTRIGTDQTLYNYSSWRAGVAYRVATGSDELIISSATSSYRSARIYQYSGTNSIGATSSNGSWGTATHSSNSITSTGDNSMVALIDLAANGSPNLTTPSGWTSDSSGSWSNGTFDACSKTLGASGSTSGATSTTGAQWWMQKQVELLALPPAETGSSTATLDSITGSAAAESGNVSVATLDALSGSASAITGAGGASTASLSSITGLASAISQALVNENHAVAVDGPAIGEVFRLVFVDSAVVASTSASSPLVFLVTADSAVLSVHAASAYRDLAVVAGSSAALSSSAPVVAVYSVSADSVVSVLAGLQFVADFTDGWAYNLNTGAGSFYEGFSFNSFALIDGEYYGANETGIFRLGSDADDSLPINMTVTLGTSNLGSPKVKRVPAAYVGAQSDEPLVLTCRVEGQEYSYTFSRATATMAPAKVQIGKGLAGVYWQLELSNTAGADAEIDELELLVAHSDRRRV